MKYGVIDIGSNSVRLMTTDGKKKSKSVIITTLSEGLQKSGRLNEEASDRTARAISFFVDEAKSFGADEIYAFATAAVRKAANGADFVQKVYDLCGVRIEVVSGEKEAMLGVMGALGGKDGGVIDIGGASTEIGAVKSGSVFFSKSIDIGAVRIRDACGQDREKAEKFIAEKIALFGEIPKSVFFGIGGTATSLAAIDLALEPYDPEKTHGYKLTPKILEKLTDKLYSLSVEERKKLKGLQSGRADIIAGGAALLLALSLKLGDVTVSENDNLEGFLEYKRSIK